jgi:hypothetical protein
METEAFLWAEKEYCAYQDGLISFGVHRNENCNEEVCYCGKFKNEGGVNFKKVGITNEQLSHEAQESYLRHNER